MGIPQCFGAIDGCNDEIQPSKENAVDYYNYKGWYSTVLMALVDDRHRFVYINTGSPGRCNDSKIHENSIIVTFFCKRVTKERCNSDKISF